MANLIPEEIRELRSAVYMIANAKEKVEGINSAMKSESRWDGQADIESFTNSLHELLAQHADTIGRYCDE